MLCAQGHMSLPFRHLRPSLAILRQVHSAVSSWRQNCGATTPKHGNESTKDELS